MASNFETTKDQFEQYLDQARDTIGDLNTAESVDEKKRLLKDSRSLMAECKKNIQEMDYLWNTLDSGEKGYYKSELVEFKQQFEMLNNDLIKYQKAIRIDEEDEESDELTKLQKETREKLLGGVGKLSDQERQLKGVVKDGYEAQNMMRQGAHNLRNQRDHIENAGRNNLKAQTEISKGDKTIRVMRLREFCYRVVLYIVIIALAAA